MDKSIEKENKNNVVVWVAIVLAVVIFLVFLTISGKKEPNNEIINGEDLSMQAEENNNMQQEIPDGVKINVLQEGQGAVAKSGDVVAMNYTGRLTDGTVFDSNVLPEFNHVEPFVFQLGSGTVIKGWDIGVEGMKVGEKRALELAPEYAYGEAGAGDVIPPNATLMFEVELVNIINQ